VRRVCELAVRHHDDNDTYIGKGTQSDYLLSFRTEEKKYYFRVVDVIRKRHLIDIMTINKRGVDRQGSHSDKARFYVDAVTGIT